MHQIAEHGISSASDQLPHLEELQAAFGADYDLSSIRCQIGGVAADSAGALGTEAYAKEGRIAFRDTPSLSVVAHEVVHVIQQRTGVDTIGGIGTAGDSYETQANAVASRVASGQSVDGLLGSVGRPASNASSSESPLQAHEGFEHRTFGDEGQVELRDYLSDEEGRQWAAQAGLDVDAILAQMSADPLMSGQLLSGNVRRRRGEPSHPGAPENRVELTSGEVIALMGDFYSSWERLVNAPPEEINGILEVMRNEETDGVSANQAAIRYDEITEGRYLRLASRNMNHFNPGNRVEWAQMHEEAVGMARRAGMDDDEGFNRALLIESGSCHFLTDAFSSGHLFDGRQLRDAIDVYIQGNPLQTQNAPMQTYAAAVEMSGNAELLVLKDIHDRMNLSGFPVINNRGMSWRMFGDGNLSRSPEARIIIELAVQLSRQQVIRARRGEDPDPNEVISLLPNEDTLERAQQHAMGLIPEACRNIGQILYAGREMAPSLFGPILGAIIGSNMEAIGRPEFNEQMRRREEDARSRGDRTPVVPFYQFAWPLGR